MIQSTIGDLLAKRSVWEEDVNYDRAVIVQLTIGSAMVFMMVIGLAYLYSGLTRRNSALSMIWVCYMSCCVIFFQWYFWGYSLAFSPTATNKFIGNLHNFGYQNTYGSLTLQGDYPEMAFANFQAMFLCVTTAIFVGAVAERGRVMVCMIFVFFWATLCYCPIACWVWNPSGWAAEWGVLDYAGGGPVEIVSGFSGFVYSYFLGRRRERLLINFRPHNVSMVALGTGFLWFGWMAFNGFTCLNPSLKSVYAIVNTNITGAFGAISWCLLDWRLERRFSTVALCSGAISGLVAATPASGIIPLWASVILGIVSGVVCNYATKIKVICRVDDSMDVLAEHGIAGVIGLVFNALFGSATVIGYDGLTEHEGGWIDHNWKQLYKQIAFIFACIGYSMAITALICFILNRIPFLQLRASEEAEEKGMDEDQIGEFAYDYVEVRRDFLAWGSGPNNGFKEPEVLDQVVPVNDFSSDQNVTNETNESEKQ
ncbi:Ammonium transporter [Komagataella phaffii CBS 7435]|uniref:Ammonium transporter n=2 Tax=Komagataella phaffii TaxID=460519 RepID=C4R1Z3_KOMPG|nr:Ammonium permease [Komagataella phaffii GS115]AOA62523.1 GQ67_00938T0 [Komagataella phaffii]KAI0461207.1 low affinity high capacity ammonium permease [Komagataella kurtzmanii]CAH2447939.1 Ammonium transporter [Komagataella phaffii CBS 7435]AOA68007.1 GQ68_00451T0 [Komagataella phaffii GS115]CAY69517.1 Ammonium permease [Komagataella phaffii GS115]